MHLVYTISGRFLCRVCVAFVLFLFIIIYYYLSLLLYQIMSLNATSFCVMRYEIPYKVYRILYNVKKKENKPFSGHCERM